MFMDICLTGFGFPRRQKRPFEMIFMFVASLEKKKELRQLRQQQEHQHQRQQQRQQHQRQQQQQRPVTQIWLRTNFLQPPFDSKL